MKKWKWIFIIAKCINCNLPNCKVQKGKSEYKGEVLFCRYFNDYWIDLRSDETFVQYLLKTCS